MPATDLAAALSQNQARQHVASLVGGPLGGLLYGIARGIPFVVDTVTFAIACVTVSRVRTPLDPPNRSGPSTRFRTELRDGLRVVVRSPLLRVFLTWAAVANLVGNGFFLVVMLRMLADGTSPFVIGVIEAVAGAAGILGAISAPWFIDRVPTGRLVITCSLAFVVMCVPLVFSVAPLLVCLMLPVGIFFNPVLNAGFGAYRVAITPDALQGRIGTATSFAAMAAMPFGPMIAGALLEA